VAVPCDEPCEGCGGPSEDGVCPSCDRPDAAYELEREDAIAPEPSAEELWEMWRRR